MKTVYLDQHTGPAFHYRRDNNRPDFPSEAVLILDTIPYPTPDVRRDTYLAAPLATDTAERFDFVFLGKVTL